MVVAKPEKPREDLGAGPARRPEIGRHELGANLLGGGAEAEGADERPVELRDGDPLARVDHHLLFLRDSCDDLRQVASGQSRVGTEPGDARAHEAALNGDPDLGARPGRGGRGFRAREGREQREKYEGATCPHEFSIGPACRDL